MHAFRRLLLRLAGLIGMRLAPAATRAHIRRILVIKPDHLGDALLLTPALALLRTSFPEAHITLLIGPWATAALHGNRSVDTLQSCAFPGFERAPKRSHLQPYMLLLQMALLLRRSRYDVALIARDDHWWGALLALLAGIPRRIGFAAPDTAPLLTEALPYDPAAHVAAQGLALVEHIAPGRRCAGPLMIAPITPDDARWAERWLLKHLGQRHERLAAVHPGSGGAAKLWLVSHWTQIVDSLMAGGWSVVVTGGKVEQRLVEEICRASIRTPLTLVDEASLGQLAAVYRHCDLVVGVDSGPLHLATATGTYTVTLFGPTDHARFGPWGPPERHQVVRSGLWCSPCGAVAACPRGTQPAECMATIKPAQVLAAITQVEPAQPQT